MCNGVYGCGCGYGRRYERVGLECRLGGYGRVFGVCKWMRVDCWWNEEVWKRLKCLFCILIYFIFFLEGYNKIR